MPILIYISVAIITIVLIFVLEFKSEKRWLKYLLFIIPLALGVASAIGAYFIPSPDFENLGEFVNAIYLFIIAALALITSIILDVRHSRQTK
jgi:multisubunit Na+/H+ antiporter MnhB subunit